MDEILQQPAFNKNVLEFLTVANDYCLFIEGSHKYELNDIISYVQKICPLLYLKGSILPKTHTEYPEANERFVTEENWEIIYHDLLGKFQDDDRFWYLDEWFFIDNELSKGSISEFLADIYQDLKDFVMLYQKNSLDAKQNAIQSVKELFARNWGYKVILVQKTIHYHLFKDSGQPLT